MVKGYALIIFISKSMESYSGYLINYKDEMEKDILDLVSLINGDNALINEIYKEIENKNKDFRS